MSQIPSKYEATVLIDLAMRSSRRRTIATLLEGQDISDAVITLNGEQDRTGRVRTDGTTVLVELAGLRVLEVPADTLAYADGEPVFGPIDSARLVEREN
jgi:hypothetical protein